MPTLIRQNTAIADDMEVVASLDAPTSWTIADVRDAVERAEPVYTNTRSGWSIAAAQEPIPPGEVAAILFDAHGDRRVTVAQLSAINWYTGDRDFRGSAEAPHPITGEGGDRIAEQLVAALA